MKVQFDYRLFDLEPRDIAVYEAMLSEAEPISIRALADKVHMNRGTTFEIIKKLVKAGLAASHYKLSRKHYAALAPDAVQKYAEERYRDMGGELDKVKEYVTELKNVQTSDALGRFSQVFEGEDEIAVLLHDVLDTVSTLPDKTYRVVSSAEVRNHMYRKFENFTKQRIKRGVNVRVIGVGPTDQLRELADRKWLSTEQTPACYIIVYGDKVAQIALGEHGNVYGSVVENAGVAQLQSLLFDRLWDAL
jgi:sugar-specific transcriptional regulator TrmB